MIDRTPTEHYMRHIRANSPCSYIMKMIVINRAKRILGSTAVPIELKIWYRDLLVELNKNNDTTGSISNSRRDNQTSM